MSDALETLRTAFESADYDVERISENRGTVRVAIRTDGADADELRSITTDVVGESTVVGLDVTHETTGDDDVGTVVSFRRRRP